MCRMFMTSRMLVRPSSDKSAGTNAEDSHEVHGAYIQMSACTGAF